MDYDLTCTNYFYLKFVPHLSTICIKSLENALSIWAASWAPPVGTQALRTRLKEMSDRANLLLWVFFKLRIEGPCPLDSDGQIKMHTWKSHYKIEGYNKDQNDGSGRCTDRWSKWYVTIIFVVVVTAICHNISMWIEDNIKIKILKIQNIVGVRT